MADSPEKAAGRPSPERLAQAMERLRLDAAACDLTNESVHYYGTAKDDLAADIRVVLVELPARAQDLEDFKRNHHNPIVAQLNREIAAQPEQPQDPLGSLDDRERAVFLAMLPKEGDMWGDAVDRGYVALERLNGGPPAVTAFEITLLDIIRKLAG